MEGPTPRPRPIGLQSAQLRHWQRQQAGVRRGGRRRVPPAGVRRGGPRRVPPAGDRKRAEAGPHSGSQERRAEASPPGGTQERRAEAGPPSGRPLLEPRRRRTSKSLSGLAAPFHCLFTALAPVCSGLCSASYKSPGFLCNIAGFLCNLAIFNILKNSTKRLDMQYSV
jgi:hypothetical protein